jgi:hypothetical protein
MQITAVDSENNLYQVQDLLPQHLVDKILSTDWLNLEYYLEEGNRKLRRRVNVDKLDWYQEWKTHLQTIWADVQQSIGCDNIFYAETGWWLDDATYTCPMHTDGEMPAALQMFWIGANTDLGTSWYWYKDATKPRYKFPFKSNNGYIMLNLPNNTGYRKLQWHAMLEPVPDNTFRVTSYSWLVPQ